MEAHANVCRMNLEKRDLHQFIIIQSPRPPTPKITEVYSLSSNVTVNHQILYQSPLGRHKCILLSLAWSGSVLSQMFIQSLRKNTASQIVAYRCTPSTDPLRLC